MNPILSFTSLVICAFTLSETSIIRSSKDAEDYLESFGYSLPIEFPKDEDDVPNINPLFGSDRPVPSRMNNETIFKEKISKFQQYAGIAPTGLFDNQTLAMMNRPRCGMAERMELSENKNINRRMLSHRIPRRRKWKTSRIFYRIETFPQSRTVLNPDVVRSEIQRAFRLWESVANIRCYELPKASRRKAEIDINFLSGEHGDNSAFGDESIGNVVAHAFFPDSHHFEGDVHFDKKRSWTAYNRTGINLFQVAAHEVGHALGLDHSMFPGSVMHMIVHDSLNDNFKLHEDDIKGIQKLYGQRRRTSRKNRPPSPIPTPPPKHRHYETADSNGNMISMDRYVINLPSKPQEKVQNRNGGVSTTTEDSRGDVPLETTLGSFWECFGLSFMKSGSKNASMCYARNVMHLIHSLHL